MHDLEDESNLKRLGDFLKGNSWQISIGNSFAPNINLEFGRVNGKYLTDIGKFERVFTYGGGIGFLFSKPYNTNFNIFVEYDYLLFAARMDYGQGINFRQSYINPSVGLFYRFIGAYYSYSINLNESVNFGSRFDIRIRYVIGRKNWSDRYDNQLW